MEIVLFWLLFAALVGFFADSRGRSGIGFFLLSALLSPLIGLIIVLVMKSPAKEAEEAKQRQAEQERQEKLRREEHELQLESIRAIAAKTSATPPGVGGTPVASVADELRKLAELRDHGVLTEDEFNAQKKVILGLRSPTEAAPSSGPLKAKTREAVVQDVNRLLDWGVCPNCDKVISTASMECKHCKASFGPGSAWKVRPLSES